MKKIKAEEIIRVVAGLAIKANLSLRKDVLDALKKALHYENNPRAKKIINILIDNARIAEEKALAICQDTGMAVVFCEIGRDLHIEGDIDKAINEGIRLGYKKGFLRKSVVSDPLIRKNTMTNTPCIIHYEFVKGDKIKLTVLPKGFGSENKSALKMFNPTAGIDEIKKFIVDTVKNAGADACPPYIVGVGIGGTADYACLLAKKALLKKISTVRHQLSTKLERDLLNEINRLNIGPAGLGGKTTCLGLNILTFATHIAGLPICINISCHALRSASKTL